MSIAAIRKPQEDVIFQNIGTVKKIEDTGIFVLENELGSFHAVRAASCLIEPTISDEVFFAGRNDGELFILGILKRISEEPTTLSTQGDTRLNVKKGRFSIISKDGVDIVSSTAVGIISKEIKLTANSGEVLFNKLTYLGRKVFTEVEAVKIVSSVLDTVADRVSQRVKNAYKFVEHLDQVRSKQIDYRAKENLNLRGRNNLIFADLLTKIDSDQIQLG